MAYIEVRPARPEDREAVLAFCRNTWEWGDYIEQTWDEWLNDPDGRLFVATVEEHPAGMVHLDMLTPIDAWLEGLRVDPQYRQQGLARALYEALLIEAMQRGAKYARQAIESDNELAQHLARLFHFRHVGTSALFHASPIPAKQKGTRQEKPRLATSDDLEAIVDFLNASNVFPLVGGLYYAHFKASPITVELLEEKIAAQQVYVLYRWERLDGLVIAETADFFGEKILSAGYIDGTAIEPISLLAYDLREQLNAMELTKIRIYAPDIVLVRDALTGVEYEWNGTTYTTYERGLE